MQAEALAGGSKERWADLVPDEVAISLEEEVVLQPGAMVTVGGTADEPPEAAVLAAVLSRAASSALQLTRERSKGGCGGLS